VMERAEGGIGKPLHRRKQKTRSFFHFFLLWALKMSNGAYMSRYVLKW
jgi:hypothetical protein